MKSLSRPSRSSRDVRKVLMKTWRDCLTCLTNTTRRSSIMRLSLRGPTLTGQKLGKRRTTRMLVSPSSTGACRINSFLRPMDAELLLSIQSRNCPMLSTPSTGSVRAIASKTTTTITRSTLNRLRQLHRNLEIFRKPPTKVLILNTAPLIPVVAHTLTTATVAQAAPTAQTPYSTSTLAT